MYKYDLKRVSELGGFVKQYRTDYPKDPEEDLMNVQHLVLGVDDLRCLRPRQ